ncbi:MAG: D-2-hydroxyacid dehydrogenase [Candidatus Zixiibacteriota bacterium]
MKTHEPLIVTCTYSREPEFARRLYDQVAADRLLSSRIRMHVPLERGEKEQILPETQVYATFRFSPEEFAVARRLKWIQIGMAGVDSALFPAMRDSNVIVTSSVGLHDETVPYVAWAFVLAFATGLHEAYRQKSAHIWDRRAVVVTRRILSQHLLLIVGTGRIGQRIALLAKHAGMTVWGVRRRTTGPKPHYFDRVFSRRALHSALRQADFVILIVPGGEATAQMIGAEELACMKPSAYLINMARGSVVDEPALIAALQNGTIAGAGLDVYATEPLPPNHPFYDLPNVAMTPHISGDTLDYPWRAAQLFLKNLRRYVTGKPLFNVVDKRRGY